MNSSLRFSGVFAGFGLLFAGAFQTGTSQVKTASLINTASKFPGTETLSYRVEWRMVTAGAAKLQLSREQQDWRIHLELTSAGLVSRLFKVDDKYTATVNDEFCGMNSNFEAQEGKRHVIESQLFDNARRKGIFDLHDLTKNLKQHKEIDIEACTHEIVGALEALRDVKIEPGRAVTLAIANQNKMANARILAQRKDNLTLNGQQYPTMLYEAFIFDNVLFRRKGLLLIWVSDDSSHTPLQMQFQMGFPIGNITLELEKAEQG